MQTIHEKAYAKLNISLDVTERRQDGYHNMVMVMQTVSLCDDITISFNDSGRVQAQSSMTFIPGDERNLAVRAALKFLEASGNTGQGMLITLNKHIPVGAGMGGGSSDAAAIQQGGMKAVALAAMDPTPARYYHTRGDTAENLDPKTVEAGIDILLETAFLFDSEGLKDKY